MNLTKVVEDFHGLADKGAVVDYAFHMILADPTEEVLYRQLPPLVREGHSSIKVFMTYDRLRIDDEKLLDVLAAALRQSFVEKVLEPLVAADEGSTRPFSACAVI